MFVDGRKKYYAYAMSDAHCTSWERVEEEGSSSHELQVLYGICAQLTATRLVPPLQVN